MNPERIYELVGDIGAATAEPPRRATDLAAGRLVRVLISVAAQSPRPNCAAGFFRARVLRAHAPADGEPPPAPGAPPTYDVEYMGEVARTFHDLSLTFHTDLLLTFHAPPSGTWTKSPSSPGTTATAPSEARALERGHDFPFDLSRPSTTFPDLPCPILHGRRYHIFDRIPELRCHWLLWLQGLKVDLTMPFHDLPPTFQQPFTDLSLTFHDLPPTFQVDLTMPASAATAVGASTSGASGGAVGVASAAAAPASDGAATADAAAGSGRLPLIARVATGCRERIALLLVLLFEAPPHPFTTFESSSSFHSLRISSSSFHNLRVSHSLRISSSSSPPDDRLLLILPWPSHLLLLPADDTPFPSTAFASSPPPSR